MGGGLSILDMFLKKTPSFVDYKLPALQCDYSPVPLTLNLLREKTGVRRRTTVVQGTRLVPAFWHKLPVKNTSRKYIDR